jgi:DNA-3-methyladenine glycosylase
LNGVDLLGQKLYILEKKQQSFFEIVSSARIGIDYAEEYKDVAWRFYKKDSILVSKRSKGRSH